MKSILVEANAKINLHLDVVSREENGYHGVVSVMQSISLCDSITVGLTDDGEYTVQGSAPDMPTGEKNIAYRAARLFFESLGMSGGARIYITKRIPMAAGLAGGSADAAGTLVSLNELCGRPYGESELCELGARLGADVPFCIAGGTKYAYGRGDKLFPLEAMPACYLVLACAGEGVSTPMAYSALDSAHGFFADGAYTPRSLEPLRTAIASADIGELAGSIYNIFEDVILPERHMARYIKSTLSECGALGAMMSGSGPSVFGIFADETSAQRARAALEEKGIGAFLCQPTFAGVKMLKI